MMTNERYGMIAPSMSARPPANAVTATNASTARRVMRVAGCGFMASSVLLAATHPEDEGPAVSGSVPSAGGRVRHDEDRAAGIHDQVVVGAPEGPVSASTGLGRPAADG